MNLLAQLSPSYPDLANLHRPDLGAFPAGLLFWLLVLAFLVIYWISLRSVTPEQRYHVEIEQERLREEAANARNAEQQRLYADGLLDFERLALKYRHARPAEKKSS